MSGPAPSEPLKTSPLSMSQANLTNVASGSKRSGTELEQEPAKLPKVSAPEVDPQNKENPLNKQNEAESRPDGGADAGDTDGESDSEVSAEVEGSLVLSEVAKACLEEIKLPGLGARLEVLWELTKPDGSKIDKWWACEVRSEVIGSRDAEGRPKFNLRYDAFEEMGFKPCSRQVVFLDGFRLTDVEDDTGMTWRVEGQEMDEDAITAAAAAEVVDLSDMAEQMQEEEGWGQQLEEQGAQAFAQLPMNQQLSVAAGFRNMADGLRGHLAELLGSKGAGYVVTSEDIKSFFNRLPSQLDQSTL